MGSEPYPDRDRDELQRGLAITLQHPREAPLDEEFRAPGSERHLDARARVPSEFGDAGVIACLARVATKSAVRIAEAAGRVGDALEVEVRVVGTAAAEQVRIHPAAGAQIELQIERRIPQVQITAGVSRAARHVLREEGLRDVIFRVVEV